MDKAITSQKSPDNKIPFWHWLGFFGFTALSLLTWLSGAPQLLQNWLSPEAGFARPWVLSLLWLVPAAIFAGKLASSNSRKLLRKFSSQKLLPKLILDESQNRRQLRIISLSLAWVFLLLSWAGPEWGTKVIFLKRRGIDLVIALDLSESMLAKDAPSSDPSRPLSRLELAKKKIKMLMELAKGERIGILAFAGQPILLCPLTTDHNTCAIWLDSLDPYLVPYGGTAIADTIKKATELFQVSRDNSRALFLLTDGDDHQKNTIKAAQLAAKKGIKIFALGFGSPREKIIYPNELPPPPPDRPKDNRPIKTKLNEKLLRELAKITKGHYLRAEASFRDIKTLFDLAKSELKAYTQKTNRIVLRESRFVPFLSLALLLFFLAWLIPRKIELPS